MSQSSWLEDGPNGLKIVFSRALQQELDYREALLKFARGMERDISPEIEIDLTGIEVKQFHAQTICILKLHFDRAGITLRCTNVPDIWRNPKGVFFFESE